MHDRQRRTHLRRRRLRSEQRLRAEIARLQARIEWHRDHPGAHNADIVATYEQMLLLRRRLLAGDPAPI